MKLSVPYTDGERHSAQTTLCQQPIILREGGAENAGRENDGHENAGHENAGMK